MTIRPKRQIPPEKKQAMLEACWRAIELAGGPRKLGRDLKLDPSSFYGWPCAPDIYVLYLENASGISRHKLRPDIFGRNCKEGRCGNNHTT